MPVYLQPLKTRKRFLSEGEALVYFLKIRSRRKRKVRAYVLFVAVALLAVSAGTKNAKPTVGINPGDFAPRIESLGTESNFSFQNHSGRYTLLNFWATYDAESRARNVQLWNEVNKLSSDKIAMYSISLDEKESIFTETVKADKLEGTKQFHEELGRKSELFGKYNLQKGFCNFLIDDKGVIIAANVTPEDLTKVLKKS